MADRSLLAHAIEVARRSWSEFVHKTGWGTKVLSALAYIGGPTVAIYIGSLYDLTTETGFVAVPLTVALFLCWAVFRTTWQMAKEQDVKIAEHKVSHEHKAMCDYLESFIPKIEALKPRFRAGDKDATANELTDIELEVARYLREHFSAFVFSARQLKRSATSGDWVRYCDTVIEQIKKALTFLRGA